MCLPASPIIEQHEIPNLQINLIDILIDKISRCHSRSFGFTNTMKNVNIQIDHLENENFSQNQIRLNQIHIGKFRQRSDSIRIGSNTHYGR